MDGVATPIIGRPRPLPGHDTPNPAYHPHTLNYEEPLYAEGWLYNNSSTVEHVLKLEPTESSDGEGASNTVAVVFAINSADGTICQKQNIHVREQPYHSIFALVMTWEDGRWVVTRAGMEKAND